MIVLKNLREKLTTWSSNTTIHAISNISRSDAIIIRVMWILFFLSALGYFSCLVVQTVISYLKFGVTTQVAYERVPSLEFPTVTFCNQKSFRYHSLMNHSTFNNLLYLKASILSSIDSNKTSLKLLDDFFFKIAYTFRQQRILLSYTIDEMLINCRFNGITCTKNDFEHVYLPGYGNCYKFNSGKNLSGKSIEKKRLSLPGKTKGLVLELFVGYESMLLDVFRTRGAIVFIQNSSTKYLSQENSIGLSTGFSFDISIQQLFNNKLSKPYGMCIKDLSSQSSYDSQLFRETIMIMGKYEQKLCLLFCLQQFISISCNCYDPMGPENKNYPVCNESKCIEQAYINFVDKSSKECFNECPVECESTSYDYRITQSDFPAEFYSQILIEFDKMYPWLKRNFSSKENLKKTTLALNVFYNDIGYTIVNEIPSKTFEQFISEIGGLMGICLGASLLSFVELFDLAIQLIIVLLKSNGKKTQVKNSNN